MNIVLQFVFHILSLGTDVYFFSSYLSLRKRVSKKTVLALILLLSFINLLIVAKQIHIFSIVNYLISTYFICFFCFEASVSTVFLLGSLWSFFSFMAESVAGGVVSVLFQIEGIKIVEYPLAMMTGYFIMVVLKLLIVLLIRRKHSAEQILTGQRGSFVIQAFVPFISFVGFVLYGGYALVRAKPDYMSVFILGVILIMLNFAYYLVFESYNKLALENYEQKLMQEKNKHMQKYYQQVESYQQEIRTVKHDLKNQLIAVQAYLKEKEVGKAERQIGVLTNKLLNTEHRDYTAHTGINALLNAKLQQAQNSGITCDFRVKAPGEIKIEEQDLASLLGNLLDNAIEACLKCEEVKYIQLNIVYFNHALIVTMKNSTDGQVKDLATRKSDKTTHGLGTKSIQSIAEKYNGDCTYRFEGNTFTTDLTLWEVL